MRWLAAWLPLRGVELEAAAEGQHRDLRAVGARDVERLRQAARAMGDDRDALAAGLVAVADRAVAHQAAADGIGQVGQGWLDIHAAGGQQHAVRPDPPRGARGFAQLRGEAVPLPLQGGDGGIDRLHAVLRQVPALQRRISGPGMPSA
jgi:hypothetical protein